MESVRNLAKKALAGVCTVVDENQAATLSEKEFAVVDVISGVYTEYAGNRPIQQRESVDVNVYALDMPRLDELMEAAGKAMRAAGFLPQDLPIDLGSDSAHQMYGAVQEFALYRVVAPDGN